MPEQAEIVANDELLEQLEMDPEGLPEGYDEDADAYAAPPPLPDNRDEGYLAELSLAGVKDPNDDSRRLEMANVKWGQDEREYAWVPITAKVLDPGGKQDGKLAFDPLLRSRPDRDGRNPVEAVYRAITGRSAPGVSLGAKAAALVRELRAHPVVRIHTQLQGDAQDFNKEFDERKRDGTLPAGWKKMRKIKGQGRFGADGTVVVKTPSGEMETVVARAAIVGYLPK